MVDLDGNSDFQAFGLAGKSAAADFAQHGFFAGEIAEESGLADFERLHDVVNARLFVAALAKKMQSRFDDLLAEARFLAFAQAGERLCSGSRATVFSVGVSVAMAVVCGLGRGRLPGGNFGAGHGAVPPARRTGAGCGICIVLVALTL